MNRKVLATTLSVLLGSTLAGSAAWAAKPEMAGQGMNREEHSMMKEERKQERTAEPATGAATRDQMEKQERERQREMDQDREMRERAELRGQERQRDRMENQDGMDNKGMEKQREMKSEQEMKELGKGSERGQEAREKRKKWWRFWE